MSFEMGYFLRCVTSATIVEARVASSVKVVVSASASKTRRFGGVLPVVYSCTFFG